MAKQIVIVKPGTLTPEEKNNLIVCGFLVIEHPEPEEVRIVTPLGESDFQIAMKAMAIGIQKGNDSSTKAFAGAELAKCILEMQEKKP